MQNSIIGQKICCLCFHGNLQRVNGRRLCSFVDTFTTSLQFKQIYLQMRHVRGCSGGEAKSINNSCCYLVQVGTGTPCTIIGLAEIKT